ncbi:MAG: hypothetical protein H0W68_14200 [Gemmatimonadaceae bacterium]|nr:hypothetical protein [Gemmatimonadaceae bacterium]
MKAFLVALGALTIAAPLAAQVGHEPARSPFADLEYSQEITPFVGYTRARHDPAGIAPGSGMNVGLRYELSLTGPLAFSTDLFTTRASRNVIDPARPRLTRSRGTATSTVYGADLAMALNLTGQRSWHRVVPQLRAGVGLMRSSAADDSSGFAFGTPFAFTFGGGFKYVPGGRVQLRADVTDRVFKLSYPDSYYRTASDNTAVLDATTARSFYTHHTMLTVGVSYLFAR